MSSVELRSSKPVAVVGLGKIGLPLAVQYVRSGRQVIGCDVNPRVVEMINAGISHVHEEPGLADEMKQAVERGLLTATCATEEAVRQASVVVVIVPVIVDASHAVDFRSLDAATEAVGAGLTAGTLVIFETTLPVGTTNKRLRGLLERWSGLVAGRDFALSYSPERVSSGSIARDLATYPKVVGGIDAGSTAEAAAFYRSVLQADVITMASTDDAEFVKLIETTYRDVNIALANEYARYADAHGLDLAAAVAAANTQPYSHIHRASVGVGGHCIPVYPYFLLNREEAGLALPRLARQVNDGMAEYAMQRIEAEVGSLADRSVLLLGISYRGDVKETACSTAFLLRRACENRGARVYADDPLYTAAEIEHLGFEPFRPELAESVEAIIVQANHRAYESFDPTPFRRCQVVLDGRSGLRREAVEAAGMRYVTIGDGHGAGAEGGVPLQCLPARDTQGSCERRIAE